MKFMKYRMFRISIVKSHTIDELYQRSKKKVSRNKRTVGGSSATSPRRNIAAIIFKQAASGRSIFSSGTRRYSNRRLDRSLGLFLKLREGYFVGNATSHPVPSCFCPPLSSLFRSNSTNLSILSRPSRLPTFLSTLEKRVRDNSWRSQGKGGIRWNMEEDGENEKREESWCFLRTTYRTEEVVFVFHPLAQFVP